jgi:hypothetical protein
MPNAPEARTETGEIKDQTPTTQPEVPPKAGGTAKEGAEGGDRPSLLNGEETPSESVPAKYEFTLPEGFQLDETVNTEVQSMFKDMKLSAANAQKLVDFYAAKTKEAVDAPFELWMDTQKKWVDEVKADPEIGKRLPEVKATVARAIDGLGDAKLAADFRQAMDVTGAGNNPAFIKAFYRLAQQVTEGRHVSGRGPSAEGQVAPDGRPKTAAEALYPTLKHS